ncbi:Neutral ceramidase 2 like protein [Verticillium longisporum]|uniref:Neutral ceramidase n=1 Tax=Verticillium longisporum TaxID=100787 RepID=A0A8I3AQQ0_VERLO|nr:Neutral ceramidase 2 like protein [Verticillium longisporum]
MSAPEAVSLCEKPSERPSNVGESSQEATSSRDGRDAEYTWRRALLIACRLTVALVLLHLVFSTGCITNVFSRYGRPASWADGNQRDDLYLLGTGKADITGPVVEINMMGYADMKQVGSGLRQRLFARAFIVGNIERHDDRFVYIVLDAQSGDTAVRYGILEELAALGPEYAVYGYRTIVDGTVLAIQRAHESLVPGHLGAGKISVKGASINRSLFSYLANPEDDRRRYNISAEDDGSVDRDLTLLNFQRASDNKSIGVLTWFPTHGTSMLGNNTLITGDNKGVAAYLFEKSVRTDPRTADNFVAGFSQANVGDVSPNVLGAWCEDGSGERCKFKDSTCSNGRSQHCHARGPYFTEKDNGAKSCFEIGRRQFNAAKMLFDEMNLGRSLTRVRGLWVKSFHNFHDMSDFHFVLPNGSAHGSNASNTSPVWKLVSSFPKKPQKEQVMCQNPKPILLDVGEVSKPYAWTPNIVDIQAFRVGQFIITVSPGEATTMAGRRWKEAVKGAAKVLFKEEPGALEPMVVLGGPANSYTHYITTQEEYSIQRYEGASTLYGPHTLAAYIDRTIHFLPYLSANHDTQSPAQETGPLPPNNSNTSLNFISGVVLDAAPIFRHFGDVKTDVRTSYLHGTTVNATFVGANPRNDLRLERTYAAVERFNGKNEGELPSEDEWKPFRDDSDWSLIFEWKRTSTILGTSEVTITWDMAGDDEEVPAGVYRLRYFGNAKGLGGKIVEFEGTSGSFVVLA